ncbi:zinc ribbon domain-containing protein [Acholeplasma oculi]
MSKNLSFSRTQSRNSFGTFACSTYRKFGKKYCTMHYITYENLYQAVLNDINKHLVQANLNEQELLSIIMKVK